MNSKERGGFRESGEKFSSGPESSLHNGRSISNVYVGGQLTRGGVTTSVANPSSEQGKLAALSNTSERPGVPICFGKSANPCASRPWALLLFSNEKNPKEADVKKHIAIIFLFFFITMSASAETDIGFDLSYRSKNIFRGLLFNDYPTYYIDANIDKDFGGIALGFEPYFYFNDARRYYEWGSTVAVETKGFVSATAGAIYVGFSKLGVVDNAVLVFSEMSLDFFIRPRAGFYVSGVFGHPELVGVFTYIGLEKTFRNDIFKVSADFVQIKNFFGQEDGYTFFLTAEATIKLAKKLELTSFLKYSTAIKKLAFGSTLTFIIKRKDQGSA